MEKHSSLVGCDEGEKMCKFDICLPYVYWEITYLQLTYPVSAAIYQEIEARPVPGLLLRSILGREHHFINIILLFANCYRIIFLKGS